ncbi:hypothetical protein BDP81DRAFT_176031 [Colletotrichum phormii]|uniref:Uncharacterized protein n=1 Tax=Colletotrichum phormii TaxID=359342 RepID=A0AAJ0EJW4_9PEZI|nr:uncharacterized protein BDP81DRAFT_176031 [Colletotrichum phormii]KAK1639355.1 hypothetical protein BDP81DRAFT_176031 [Colletotrichum phormii]
MAFPSPCHPTSSPSPRQSARSTSQSTQSPINRHPARSLSVLWQRRDSHSTGTGTRPGALLNDVTDNYSVCPPFPCHPVMPSVPLPIPAHGTEAAILVAQSALYATDTSWMLARSAERPRTLSADCSSPRSGIPFHSPGLVPHRGRIDTHLRYPSCQALVFLCERAHSTIPAARYASQHLPGC